MSCGVIVEFQNEAVEKLQNEIAENTGVRPQNKKQKVSL